MSPLQKKIDALKGEKQKIEAHIQELERHYHEEILEAMASLSLTSLDLPTLLGGMQYVITKALDDPSTQEAWRKAGQTFCQRLKAQKTRSSKAQASNTKTSITLSKES
tara:strand:+ start:313 stop:636 length:324 start_codon:yes stop_codon:yes gene_type:complete